MRDDDVSALEQLYAENPARYRRKVVGLVALGYGYIALLIAVALGVTAGGIVLFASGTLNIIYVDNFIKGAIPLLVVVGLLMRALLLRIPAPDGIALTGELRDAAIRFFDGVRAATGGARIDEVIVDDQLNAAVRQTPKFGLIGPSRNYLILGAPLLRALDAEELKAVIAHEFGHLSHAHGRMGAQVYRLNHTLESAARVIEERNKSGTGLLGFSFRQLQWFLRRFDRLTFPMRRGQEYEADSVAARATSSTALAAALCKLHVIAEPLGRCWDDVWRQARRQATSERIRPHRLLPLETIGAVPAAQAEAAIAHALQRATDAHDTHPALAERLRALGTKARYAPQGGAMDAMFSPQQKEALLELVDAEWQRTTRASWAEQHRRYAEAEREMASLAARVEELDGPKLLRLARLQEDLDGRDAARSTFERLVTRHPKNAAAQFHWGRIRFGDDFAAAEPAFLEALELDVELTPEVLPYLRAGYEHGGRTADLADLDARAERFEAHRRRAEAERESVRPEDPLLAPQLPLETIDALARYFAELPEIRRAFLVQKQVSSFRGHPVYLVGFDINRWHDNVESDQAKWLQRIATDLSRRFPLLADPFTVLMTKRGPWRPRLEHVAGACIYQAEGRGAGLWEGLKTIYSTVWSIVVVGALLWLAYDWLVGG